MRDKLIIMHMRKGCSHTNDKRQLFLSPRLAAPLGERGKANARTNAHAGNLSVLNILPPLKGLALNGID